jgi:hypothetical protein
LATTTTFSPPGIVAEDTPHWAPPVPSTLARFFFHSPWLTMPTSMTVGTGFRHSQRSFVVAHGLQLTSSCSSAWLPFIWDCHTMLIFLN